MISSFLVVMLDAGEVSSTKWRGSGEVFAACTSCRSDPYQTFQGTHHQGQRRISVNHSGFNLLSSNIIWTVCRRVNLGSTSALPLYTIDVEVAVQLCGARGGGQAAARALYWVANKGLSLMLVLDSERERNAAILLARRFADDQNVSSSLTLLSQSDLSLQCG